MITEIVVIVVLIAITAFMAASELSIVSSRKPYLRSLADDGNRGAHRVLRLVANPSRFLATIQVGVTLAGFFESAVGAVSIAKLLTHRLATVHIAVVSSNASTIALILSTIFLSFITIVFGELVPKTLAVHRTESLAMKLAGPIEWVSKIARPIVFLLTASTNLVLRLFGVEARAAIPSVTREELLSMLETAEDEGVVEATDADLIEEAFSFGDIVARSIMVPRVDVAAVEARARLEEIVARFFSSGFSRLPVFRDSLDNVIGVLHVKDVFRVLHTDGSGAATTAEEVMRPVYFVPETKPIDELLAELRARHTQLAIVIDEFGGVAGIVTLEDVIEELVGEITDEFDPGYEPFRAVEPGVIEVDGRVSVVDLLDRLELEREMLPDYEGESVGGLIAYLVARIPREGDVATIGPLRLEVHSMNGNRVSRVFATDERILIEAEGGEDPPDSGVERPPEE
ncbi:MAG TPA: hemolysin family protein [Thermomicrobiaceae bacterium]|nr:hemolysin family protein [Thermomicrobiaceae bacterium]